MRPSPTLTESKFLAMSKASQVCFITTPHPVNKRMHVNQTNPCPKSRSKLGYVLSRSVFVVWSISKLQAFRTWYISSSEAPVTALMAKHASLCADGIMSLSPKREDPFARLIREPFYSPSCNPFKTKFEFHKVHTVAGGSISNEKTIHTRYIRCMNSVDHPLTHKVSAEQMTCEYSWAPWAREPSLMQTSGKQVLNFACRT